MFGCHRCLTKYHSYAGYFLYPGFLPYLIIFTALLFSSSGIQAGANLNIAKYTSQRDKSADISSPGLQAEKSPAIEISEQGGRYHIKVVTQIAAPANHVLNVLTDFKHIYRLNPSIIESEVVQHHEDESVSVRTKIIGCAAYFCEELNRVERVRRLPSGEIRADIVPELSQFRAGHALWRVTALGDRSKVSYDSEMQPDIYIPPVVGKYLLKKSIREEMRVSFASLEKIARIMAEREWQDDYRPVSTELMKSEGPCVAINDDDMDLFNEEF